MRGNNCSEATVLYPCLQELVTPDSPACFIIKEGNIAALVLYSMNLVDNDIINLSDILILYMSILLMKIASTFKEVKSYLVQPYLPKNSGKKENFYQSITHYQCVFHLIVTGIYRSRLIIF